MSVARQLGQVRGFCYVQGRKFGTVIGCITTVEHHKFFAINTDFAFS